MNPWFRFGFFRNCFVSESDFLSFSRFRMTDFGIFVAFRIFGMMSAFDIISRKRLVTISLFLSWLRSSSQFKINIPSLVNLDCRFNSAKAISASDNADEFFKSKDSTTLDDTLLTFCPPAPLLRTALKLSSDMSFSGSKINVAGAPILISH